MDTPLGKPTPVPGHYDPGILAPVDRAEARAALGLGDELPFVGEDVWNGYELSWLSPSGLPRVAALQIRVSADSPRLVESKSVKLYLNGFAQSRFESKFAVGERIRSDLSAAAGAEVTVSMVELGDMEPVFRVLPGLSLDNQHVSADVYRHDPGLLRLTVHDPHVVEETLHTDVFRSLCPVTGQPDSASVLVRYRGPAIDHGSLLRYLVSFRSHQAFHETTIEQMFLDLKARCGCERLMVGGYFLRRGGLDINPFRADPGEPWPVVRLVRQ